MKIRNGYVSNSSSSSYIIEFKDITNYMTVAGKILSLNSFFDYIQSGSNFNLETGMKEITFEENEKNKLIKYIEGEAQFAEGEQKENLINLINDIKNNTETNFARFNLSYHDKVGNFVLGLLNEYEVVKIRNRFEA